MQIVHASDPLFDSLWRELWKADEFQHPFLSDLDVEYMKEYAKESKFEDVSFLIVEQQAPIVGARMAIRTNPAGEKELSGFGRPIMYCESSGIDAGRRAGAHTVFRTEIQRLESKERPATSVYRELRPILSPWGSHLLEIGAQAKPHFTQVIDLPASESELRSRVRKSYKSLINWGEKHLQLALRDCASVTSDDIEAFRLLHVEVAGRETRSRRTWELQLEMVRQKEAFLILGRFDEALVTAALFIHSPRYCYYGVSASKRELFEKPLAHVVLWKAIQHAKEIGCRWFETGDQLFLAQTAPPPTTKELGISAFKKGFGGDTHIRTDIIWKK